MSEISPLVEPIVDSLIEGVVAQFGAGVDNLLLPDGISNFLLPDGSSVLLLPS